MNGLKKYNFNTVEGMTMNQLQQHYKLYEGYVNKLKEINKELMMRNSYTNPSATYSKLRSLKKGETYSLDGIILHELYFGNITGNKGKSSGKILDYINRDFGSYNNFVQMFTDVGLSMRGWVVLIQGDNGRLAIIGQDSHDDGSVWYGKPVLVMDVYEHAYMIDFGIDRKKYIKVFFDNINWQVVNKRLTKA